MGEKGHRFGTETLRTGAEELTHEAQVLTHGVMTAPFRLRTYRLIRKILIGFILVSIAAAGTKTAGTPRRRSSRATPESPPSRPRSRTSRIRTTPAWKNT